MQPAETLDLKVTKSSSQQQVGISEKRLKDNDMQDRNMLRRDFLKAASVAAGMAARAAGARASATLPASRLRIEAFDYEGVRLLKSRWQEQVQRAREFYMGLPDDDILHGFRVEAGLPAPGKALGGWARRNTGGVFGQWLSGMARMYRATGDATLRDKAVHLMREWGKTVRSDGDCRMGHYAWDKLVCGLVDLYVYAGEAEAVSLLEKTAGWAAKNLSRENMPAVKSHNTFYSGRPGEWYTLAENLYRAYQATGNRRFNDFAQVWLYHFYWDKFDQTPDPPDAEGVHAYSHLNTFSSAAMHYAVTGDPKYLRIIRNAYEYFRNRQCYATGGYGPNERLMAADGSLGKALETRSDTFETLCGSWAAFKLCGYLMQFTGEARYGDWIEKLFYNGAGAALPLQPGGRNFYYSDYRVGGGMKVYRWDNFTCCSGTYFQDMADYHNLIYYKDGSSLYVNLYVPSQVAWSRGGTGIKVTQQTDYPVSETTTLTLEMTQSAEFPLKLRVPEWCSEMSVKVNASAVNVACKPGTWATVERRWNSGDRVEARIPLRLCMQPVDRQHPDRVAVVRGPVALALDFDYHDPAFELPGTDDELNKWLVRDDSPLPSHFSAPAVPGMFRVERPDGRNVRLRFRPFYAYEEGFPYLMYIDRKAWPHRLW